MHEDFQTLWQTLPVGTLRQQPIITRYKPDQDNGVELYNITFLRSLLNLKTKFEDGPHFTHVQLKGPMGYRNQLIATWSGIEELLRVHGKKFMHLILPLNPTSEDHFQLSVAIMSLLYTSLIKSSASQTHPTSQMKTLEDAAGVESNRVDSSTNLNILPPSSDSYTINPRFTFQTSTLPSTLTVSSSSIMVPTESPADSLTHVSPSQITASSTLMTSESLHVPFAGVVAARTGTFGSSNHENQLESGPIDTSVQDQSVVNPWPTSKPSTITLHRNEPIFSASFTSVPSFPSSSVTRSFHSGQLCDTLLDPIAGDSPTVSADEPTLDDYDTDVTREEDASNVFARQMSDDTPHISPPPVNILDQQFQALTEIERREWLEMQLGDFKQSIVTRVETIVSVKESYYSMTRDKRDAYYDDFGNASNKSKVGKAAALQKLREKLDARLDELRKIGNDIVGLCWPLVSERTSNWNMTHEQLKEKCAAQAAIIKHLREESNAKSEKFEKYAVLEQLGRQKQAQFLSLIQKVMNLDDRDYNSDESPHDNISNMEQGTAVYDPICSTKRFEMTQLLLKAFSTECLRPDQLAYHFLASQVYTLIIM